MELAWKPSGKSQAKGRWKFFNFETKNNESLFLYFKNIFEKI